MVFLSKLPDLKLKTLPKQPLGNLMLDIALSSAVFIESTLASKHVIIDLLLKRVFEHLSGEQNNRL